MTLHSLSLSCFSFFSYWCPRVGRNQWPWFIAAIYIKIPTLKLGEPPVDSWLHYRLRKERGACRRPKRFSLCWRTKIESRLPLPPPERIVARASVRFQILEAPYNEFSFADRMEFYRWRWHERVRDIVDIDTSNFVISPFRNIDRSRLLSPFNTARWILLFKRGSRKRRWNRVILLLKFNSTYFELAILLKSEK